TMFPPPGKCPVSKSKMSSFDSTIRIPSSLRCFSSQSVSTSASGCAYSVGCVAIEQKRQAALLHEQEISPRASELRRAVAAATWRSHFAISNFISGNRPQHVIESNKSSSPQNAATSTLQACAPQRPPYRKIESAG